MQIIESDGLALAYEAGIKDKLALSEFLLQAAPAGISMVASHLARV